MSSRGWMPALVLAGGLLACLPALAQRPIYSADTELYHLRYADSLDSVNDRCVVARNRLSGKVRPVYVNGRPVGFC